VFHRVIQKTKGPWFLETRCIVYMMLVVYRRSRWVNTWSGGDSYRVITLTANMSWQ